MELPREGLVAVVKRDCPTCVLIEPVLAALATGPGVHIFTQDDPAFPAVDGVVDDTALEASYHLDIEIVPTLIRFEGGAEKARVFGWNAGDWRGLTGIADLGDGLPENRPGCGSKSVDPGMPEKLAARFGDSKLAARRVELSGLDDEQEMMFAKGWTDGLPVVPPTEERVIRMLAGTGRDPQEVIGAVPPDLVPVTVEKVAINAVMAGCKPEYMPVVLTATEIICDPKFGMHGLLATTMFGGPVAIVNGPIAARIGMNWKGNALGQGFRANSTIGRAIQLVIRNVGGGRPQGVDRSTLGNPGKHTFCFAEDETDPCWEPLSVQRGFAPGTSTVSLFSGEGVQGIVDQKSRDPESLARSFAACLRAIHHPKMLGMADAILVVSPEHLAVFQAAGWSKDDLNTRINNILTIPGHEVVNGADGIAEGMPEKMADKMLKKFRPGGLTIVRAGGGAGKFSAIICGWAASGEKGLSPQTREIRE